jgi:hypothetical protein
MDCNNLTLIHPYSNNTLLQLNSAWNCLLDITNLSVTERSNVRSGCRVTGVALASLGVYSDASYLTAPQSDIRYTLLN